MARCVQSIELDPHQCTVAADADDPDGLCILHSRQPGKNVDRFRQTLVEILRRGQGSNADLSRVVFVDAGLHFGTLLKGTALELANSEFLGDADFRNAGMRSLGIRGCIFRGGADFTGAGPNFLNAEFAKFHGSAVFRLHRIGNTCSFADAEFQGDADFSNLQFGQGAIFSRSKFRSALIFERVKVEGDLDFTEASFVTASFRFTSARKLLVNRGTFDGRASFKDLAVHGDASFVGVRFQRGASFLRANVGKLDFREACFGPAGTDPKAVAARTAVADLRDLKLASPSDLSLRAVNQRSSTGLRLRARGCNLSRARLDDVRWYRESGRLVIQDEVDTRRSGRHHEMAAIVYRQLISNFREQRNHDRAEDCMWGSMEMLTIDPSRLPGGSRSRSLKSLYRRSGFARTVGSLLTVRGWYRLLSSFGSSYRRAGLCLLVLVLLSGAAFAFTPTGLTLRRGAQALSIPTEWQCSEPVELGAGLAHSVEVATFQRDRRYEVRTALGTALEMITMIVLPAQAALLLLALRRRLSSGTSQG